MNTSMSRITKREETTDTAQLMFRRTNLTVAEYDVA